MEPQFKENFFPNLFSWKELENFINSQTHLVPHKFPTGLQAKEDLFLNEWHGLDGGPWKMNDDEIPIRIFKNFINKHGVFYFMDCSRVKKEFNDFCLELEELEGRAFDTHIFVHYKKLKQKHPFGCHWDTQSNVVVQCEGQTHWKVWPRINPKDYPEKSEDGAGNLTLETEPIIDVVLKAGDALWVPHHYPHEAKSTTKRISVSFAGHREKTRDRGMYRNREWVTL